MGKKNTVAQQHHATFEGIRCTDAEGHEHWLARDLAKVLDYLQWRNFLPVLDKAREACANSGQAVDDHFADIRKMVDIGSGAQREVEDVRLSRYACYLIVQNADPSKPVIANGQTTLPSRRTTKWGARCARPLPIWVAPCLSSCQRQRPASSSSHPIGTSWASDAAASQRGTCRLRARQAPGLQAGMKPSVSTPGKNSETPHRARAARCR